ncbi:MAG: glycosyltransferase family 2 protein [Saprospiraceae bacterium]|nr:glycosyltransferase family 2 protein [Saprospiraceae bacterium]
MRPRIYIVIPAKNEAFRIGNVLYEVKNEGFDNIIVVDDGSTDRTGEIAESFGATVLTHFTNLGPGAATQTGIEYALQCGAEIIVTIDGDEQHFASDIQRLIDVLESEPVDVALGSRFIQREPDAIPSSRVVYNKIGNFVTRVVTGVAVTDSQCGMKAFRAGFAEKIQFQFNGYEFCTELIYIIRKQKARYKEVPVRVSYTRESMRKGQSLLNGFRMFFRLIKYYV